VRAAWSALLLLSIAACCLIAPANSVQARDPSLIYERPPALTAGDYFVDFRARPSTYLGHTFVVFGRLDGEGRVAELHYAGLVPEHDVWQGLFIPVEANVRQYKDDTKYLPVAIYRRRLNPIEYQRVVRTVRTMQASEHRWHAVFQNCNSFAVDIAAVLGLARPPSLLPPAVWVGMLKGLNPH